MSKPVDLTGLIFGKLTAVRPTERRRGCNIIWECQCSCGKIAYVSTADLRRKDKKAITSCGCIRRRKDISGMRFGRLTSIMPTDGRDSSGNVMWLTKCDCGNFAIVAGRSLTGGFTKSCGCLQKEIVSSINSKKIGPLHHNWNPKITDEERIQGRNFPEYYEWHKAVFERDDYTCQKCGERGGELHTHHILGYADNRNERTLLSNGITLCKKCHKNYHHVYGLIATEETFNEWMKKE